MNLYRFEATVHNHLQGTLPYSGVSYDFEANNGMDAKKLASQHAKKFAPILKDKKLRWKTQRMPSWIEIVYEFGHLAPHGTVKYYFRVYKAKQPSQPIAIQG